MQEHALILDAGPWPDRASGLWLLGIWLAVEPEARDE